MLFYVNFDLMTYQPVKKSVKMGAFPDISAFSVTVKTNKCSAFNLVLFI